MSKHVLAFVLGAVAVACGYRSNAGTTTVTSAPMNTGGQADLARTVGAFSDRIAASFCAREARCGRQSDACTSSIHERARGELSAWNCSPAAARARVEECLASFDSASCDEISTSGERPLCNSNAACGREAVLDPPGRELGAEELGSRGVTR